MQDCNGYKRAKQGVGRSQRTAAGGADFFHSCVGKEPDDWLDDAGNDEQENCRG